MRESKERNNLENGNSEKRLSYKEGIMISLREMETRTNKTKES